MNKDSELPKRVLELNPQHSLVRSLAAITAKDANDPFIADACEQLFEGAMLVDGYLSDPHRFVDRMNRVLDDAAKRRAVD
jgi:molecular chaperone HtpG